MLRRSSLRKNSTLAIAAAIVLAGSIRAEDAPNADSAPKPVCDCKPMGVTITRNGKVVNAIEAGPRAITNTDISNFAFTPTITINAGDTVTWTNKDGAPHTATSDATPAVFDSGTLNLNDSYSFTFLTAGSFPYHCAIHPFMTGTVV